MNTPDTTNNPGLDNLAAQADALGTQADASNVPPIDPMQAQQEAAAQAAMQAGCTKLFFGVLKAVRSMVAKKLPEILQHWPDEDLRNVSEAAFPVLNKHMARLMPLIGAYPEEAALAMAALPLMLGYFAAMSSHADKEERVAKQAATSSGAPSQAPPTSNVVEMHGDGVTDL